METWHDHLHPLQGLRILVVDDEILIALDIEDILREAGAVIVGPCLTLEQALRAAIIEPFDAAVMDVQIGSQTTEPVATVLADRHIPCLFHSGDTVPVELRAKVPNAGVLAKPAARNALVKAVAELA